MRLMRTHTLVFTRPPVGFYSGGKWTTNTIPTSVEAVGSLQPYQEGETSLLLPEGTRSEHAKVFLTLVELQTSDPITGLRADHTIIKGRRFEVKDFEDWTGNGLSTDHYEYLLVASPAPTDGK